MKVRDKSMVIQHLLSLLLHRTKQNDTMGVCQKVSTTLQFSATRWPVTGLPWKKRGCLGTAMLTNMIYHT